MRELDKLDAFVQTNADKSDEAALSLEGMIKAIYDFVVGSANPDVKETETEDVDVEVDDTDEDENDEN